MYFTKFQYIYIYGYNKKRYMFYKMLIHDYVNITHTNIDR